LFLDPTTKVSLATLSENFIQIG